MQNEAAIVAPTELAALLVEAWRVFGRYRFGRPLEVCRCRVCVSHDKEATLLGTLVQELTAPALQAYTDSAHESTPYADDQYRALLPRYFELCAEARWPASSPELVFRRLYHSRWHDWPSDQVALIERFFAALFAAWLHDQGRLGATPADDLLGLVVYAGGSIEPLLAVWDTDRSLAAGLKLARFIMDVRWAKRVQRLGAFWEDSREVEEHILGWLRRPKTHVKLTETFFLTDDADEQYLISSAELVI